MVDMLAAIFTDCHFADTLSQEVLVTRQAGTYSEGGKLPCRFGAPRARIWEDTIPVQNWNVAMSRAVEEGLMDLSLNTGVSSNFITVSTIKIIHKLKDVIYNIVYFQSCLCSFLIKVMF